MEEKRPKVLLLQEYMAHYREPIFSLLSDKVDLTVGYIYDFNYECCRNYKLKKLRIFKFGPFTFVKNIRSICRKYDVVISNSDPHQFSLCSIIAVHNHFKVIDWNIGVRASYEHRYILPPPNNWYTKFSRFLNRRADAVLLYMPQPIEYCVSKSLPREKFFAAHNTVQVLDKCIDWERARTHFLFIGTLYPQKKVDELLRAYIKTIQDIEKDKIPVLDIIGDGTEKSNLEEIVSKNSLNQYVVFHGSITDEGVLFDRFQDAMLCISPDQAGLSVLKSMGYGVPYVTRSNAITGGERYNIENGVNGFFYDTEEELVQIMKKAISNQDEIKMIGKNAYHYYQEHATPQIMAKGFLDAIDYVLKN